MSGFENFFSIDNVPNISSKIFHPVILLIGRLDSIEKTPSVLKNLNFLNYLVVLGSHS